MKANCLICNFAIGEETYCNTMPKITSKQKENMDDQKFPLKEKVTCKGCDKEFKLLLSHLERTKSCQESYDMQTMRQEANTLTKERKAQRSREHYKQHSEEKRQLPNNNMRQIQKRRKKP